MESPKLAGILGSERDMSRLLGFDDLESSTGRPTAGGPRAMEASSSRTQVLPAEIVTTNYDTLFEMEASSSRTQVLPASSSTSEMPNYRLHPGIEAVLTSIVALAEDPDLREADDGSLHQVLLKLCQDGGPLGMAVLRESYHRGQMTASGYREVLARLGEIEHGPSQEARWYILCSGLAEQEPVVRSGASLGLVDLRDERGLQALGRAAEFERIPLLKRRMELALQELQRCTQE